MEQPTIGLDISQGSADAFVYYDDALPKAPRDFYESPDFDQCHTRLLNNIEGLNFIVSRNPKVVIFEGTGSYSAFWIRGLENRNVPFLPLFCHSPGILNKRRKKENPER